jgi:hypothetical protein
MTARKTDVWNCILSLAVFKDGHLYPCGSAFLVGRYLAMTATHILEQPFDQRTYNIKHGEDPDFGVIAIQIVNRRRETLLWKVKSMYSCPSMSEIHERSFDVAFLNLEPFASSEEAIENFRWWFFELNVAPPKIGTKITAYGFTNPRIDQNEPISFNFSFRAKFHRVEGTITDLHIPVRDSGVMAFPCFQVDQQFEPGMSGGPIFNKKDQICGVVSRGSDFGISWGSIIWPALAINVNGKMGLDLAKDGKIRARNFHCVKIHYEDGKKFPSVSFDPNLQKRPYF